MRKLNRVHLPITHRPVHLTYRLHGSIPGNYIEAQRSRRDLALEKLSVELSSIPDQNLSALIKAQKTFEIQARYELALDTYLHEKSNGPYYLSDPDLAKVILDSYAFLHNRSELYVYTVCVMANHVHAIVRAPETGHPVDPGALMARHKSFTAKSCNKRLGRSGLPFWDNDYFDRIIRKGKFERVMWYVLNNPVKAGLVDNWRQWSNCWINPDYESLFTPL